jgi:hypothetical protein
MAGKLLQIIIRDRHNIPIYQGDISDIGLSNAFIIQKSIEWYNRANPCHRYKEAVRGRAILELVDYLQTQKQAGIIRVHILSIPASMRQSLEYYRDAISIDIVS